MKEHERFTPKGTEPSTPGASVVPDIASLDSEEPARQMEAIDAAMQQYFEAEDWIAKRNKVFPGLARY
jgi:hypothetical protein